MYPPQIRHQGLLEVLIDRALDSLDLRRYALAARRSLSIDLEPQGLQGLLRVNIVSLESMSGQMYKPGIVRVLFSDSRIGEFPASTN